MALTGNELVLVNGIAENGAPSGVLEFCRTQDIANLGGGGGGNARIIAKISANTTAGSAANTDYVYFCTATLTLTLPGTSGNTNRYSVKNWGSGIVTVAGTIDGATNFSMPQEYSTADFLSDGSTWGVF